MIGAPAETHTPLAGTMPYATRWRRASASSKGVVVPELRTALVIPCYNEEQRLPLEVLRGFATSHPTADLLLVDDGSTDGTWPLLEQLASEVPAHVSALHLEPNGGKAEAVRRGMLALVERGYRLVGFWDADLATPLDAVNRFVDVLAERPEVQWVFGARVRLLGRSIDRRPVRHYLGRVFATMASAVLGVPVYDTQCGAKLFRASPALEAVLERPFLSRWIFDVEMIARLLQVDPRHDAARSIYEVPLLEWHDVAGSKVRPSDFARAFLELMRLRAAMIAPRFFSTSLPTLGKERRDLASEVTPTT